MICIAIPTYNRELRLKKSLEEIYNKINSIENKNFFSIFVSDNGSTDNTRLVLEHYSVEFKRSKINFNYQISSKNYGFDRNAYECYKRCNSDYIWFLSDDDNIENGAFDVILDCIKSYDPNVIFFNFNQSPFGKQTPLIEENIFHEKFLKIDQIENFVKSPKLSSVVVKINNYYSGLKVSGDSLALDSGYFHVLLTTEEFLNNGRLLYSNFFIASPDDDYMEHVDFPPYIFNSLIDALLVLFNRHGHRNITENFRFKRINPLNSSLRWISSYYRGRLLLRNSLKRKLLTTIKKEIKNSKTIRSEFNSFVIASLIFVISIVYWYFIKIIFRKDIRRICDDTYR
jgi:glycosyltransferase involved in cell wall biosynthesis